MIRNYLLVAWKVLQRRKFFTFISLFAISFTLMVLVVATAFLDHTFSPQAPDVHQDRTLGVYRMQLESADGNNISVSDPGYKFLDKYVRTLQDVEKVSLFTTGSTATTYRGGEAIKLALKKTDGEFWEILQFNFLDGRPLTREDEANANPVAVINRATSEKLFGGTASVGKKLELDGQNFTVVGVVENVSFLRKNPYADVWVPISTSRSSAYKDHFMSGFQALILAKSSDDLPAVKAQFNALLPTVELPNPKDYSVLKISADSFFESASQELIPGDYGKERSGLLIGLLILFMLLFMLLPTLNLVNVNISRIIERSSEIGVRKAFGASSATLVGQFITENLMLTALGAVLGFLFSLGIVHWFNEAGWIPYLDLSLNFRVFGYGLLIMFLFGLLSGVYPAWKMSKMHPVDALKGNTK